MASQSGEEDPPSDQPAAATNSESESLFEGLKAFLHLSAELFQSYRALLGAEARLFVVSLLWLLGLVVILAFMLGVVWFFLSAAAVWLLIRWGGLDPALALLLAAFCSLLLMLGLGFWMAALVRYLRFEHSRRALSGLLSSGGAAVQSRSES